ncbi:Meiotic Sister-Chromatid recombination aldehyde dehydrogenase [Steccherinum ochraceum]|uniref:Meiotic Sister-Chromatid recombination aldehyde dehydrogenase n=1 Tax=Steccherinum ochraceum TaxID=92696 RepID=A0A4R0RHM5_9APHY|nr:Meiotic Sister-Chromatid recombination aldehyde dehydrogenase [Steccherinum ochraceum]
MPYDDYDYDYDYEEEGFGIVWPLTICLALGIYLVFERYRSVRNRAVPFRVAPPEHIGPTWDAPKIDSPRLESHELDPTLRPPQYATERKYITCYDPATSYHLDTIMADDAPTIAAKIDRAGAAQADWSKTTFRERKRVMRSLKKWLVDNQATAAKVAARDTGKTLLDAALGEILVTCTKLDWLVNHGERVLKPDFRYSNFLMFYKTAQVQFEPLGVVAAIVSWNYPLHNAWSPMMAALFSGNSIVIKCSENVIWSTQFFVKVAQTCLEACGHNPDLVQLVCCYPDQAPALTKSPYIRHITFIGSEKVGRIIVKDATEHLTPVTLELGGKDPAIIMPATPVEQYLSVIMRGIFQNSGQNCIGIERVLVHSSQYDQVFKALAERAQQLRLGCALSRPTDGLIPVVDCGAMISNDRFDELKALIEAAVNHGAIVETGGQPWPHPYLENGFFFSPTVIGNVDPNSEIAQRELFAPIVLVYKYETLEEAVAIANGTRYGLGASVFGPDQERCEQLAKKLVCGMVAINDFATFYSACFFQTNQDLPFGGTKMSGYGRFGGPEGLRSLTNPKAIVSDRWPWLIQTTIPQIVDYPIRSVNQSWDFISGLIGFVYGDTWHARIRHLIRLINANGR